MALKTDVPSFWGLEEATLNEFSILQLFFSGLHEGGAVRSTSNLEVSFPQLFTPGRLSGFSAQSSGSPSVLWKMVCISFSTAPNWTALSGSTTSSSSIILSLSQKARVTFSMINSSKWTSKSAHGHICVGHFWVHIFDLGGQCQGAFAVPCSTFESLLTSSARVAAGATAQQSCYPLGPWVLLDGEYTEVLPTGSTSATRW